MRARNLKYGFICLLTALSIYSTVGNAEEYIYRDVMGNTLPPQKCAPKPDADANASDSYNVNKYKKIFCETQGYGWHVAEEKGGGKLVCDECNGDGNKGKYQCRVEDIVVTCKRLKPGSVGLIPGKG
ncbi:MAG: hypothetical protein PHE55_07565 [Methylococcaceae bacterium]|nr:hypothetical protein [Methylococcaceae bacterium]